jgi:uncharacterized protein YfaS (alpha-2-macroglobulin family)
MNRKAKLQDKGKTLLKGLISTMDEQAGKAQFSTDQASFNNYFLDTNLRSQCAMQLAFLEIDSSHSMVSKLQNYIMESRKNGRWYNTQENFFCFYASSKYVDIYENEKANFSIRTDFKQKEIHRAELDLKQTTSNFKVDISSLKPGERSKLAFHKNGKGRLYYSAWLKYAKAELPSERINRGFRLEKKMFRFKESSGTWEKLDYKAKLKLGEIVRVRLDIDTRGVRTHIGLDDPFAACFTPVNTELATTALGSKAFSTDIDGSSLYQRNGEFNWNSAFRFMEMRKTSVQFYAPRMKAGSYGLEYDLRVTSTGEFTQNAPSIEEMYYPDTRGTGLGRKFVVTD